MVTATQAPRKSKRIYGPPANKRPADERFWEKVDASGDCWEWTAYRSRGYGQFHPRAGCNIGAHIYAYTTLVGPIEDGLELDHLCRNHGCVNPDHLEPVTRSENQKRGFNPIARRRHKTICAHGHRFEGDNVGRHKDGTRYCRTCSRERTRLRDLTFGNSPAKRLQRRAA